MPNRLRRKLLFVDDDSEMHFFMSFALEGTCALKSVFSGKEALKAVAQEEFPVVILDLQMEGMSGLETLARLQEKNDRQKIIILTGHDTKESAIAALNLGAFHYLIKPFQNGDLLDVLERAFERYEKETPLFPGRLSSHRLQTYGLSERQSQIAFHAIRGETNPEIAERLRISHRTVEKHMEQIFSVLKVASRAKLVAKFREIKFS